MRVYFFCFNDSATTEIYTLSLHDALPISLQSDVLCHCDLHSFCYCSSVLDCDHYTGYWWYTCPDSHCYVHPGCFWLLRLHIGRLAVTIDHHGWWCWWC